MLEGRAAGTWDHTELLELPCCRCWHLQGQQTVRDFQREGVKAHLGSLKPANMPVLYENLPDFDSGCRVCQLVARNHSAFKQVLPDSTQLHTHTACCSERELFHQVQVWSQRVGRTDIRAGYSPICSELLYTVALKPPLPLPCEKGTAQTQSSQDPTRHSVYLLQLPIRHLVELF